MTAWFVRLRAWGGEGKLEPGGSWLGGFQVDVEETSGGVACKILQFGIYA